MDLGYNEHHMDGGGAAKEGIGKESRSVPFPFTLQPKAKTRDAEDRTWEACRTEQREH